MLLRQLEDIAETPYFRPALTEYLDQLRESAKALLAKHHTIPPLASDLIAYQISAAAQFLAGSTSKRVPYEIAHCLRLALGDWTSDDVLVTTALSPDLEAGFYFKGVHNQFSLLVAAFLGIQFKSELAQISLPQIYRHRPLYTIPLYHELGHFLDVRFGVSVLTLKNNPPLATVPIDHERSHRMEHFADLFCANYAGAASTQFLVDFAGMQGGSPSHPSTADRLAVVGDFLAGTQNPLVDMFQGALTQLSLPALKQRYLLPPVQPYFDNVCPCKIASDAECHGILLAGYQYLRNAVANTPAPWDAVGEHAVEEIINDLVEKSIRTNMVNARWTQAQMP